MFVKSPVVSPLGRHRTTGLLSSIAVAMSLACTTASAETTIEFVQWWAPELPANSFREIMDGFEAQNPDIKVELVSGPYSAIRDQIVVGAATGTLSDVVGLDGAWVNDLAKQGAIAPLDDLMDSSGFDRDQVADIIQVDGSSYMFPVASFVYPMYVNLDIAKAAGIEELPTNRTEFVAAARAMTDASSNRYGWVLPLSLRSWWSPARSSPSRILRSFPHPNQWSPLPTPNSVRPLETRWNWC